MREYREIGKATLITLGTRPHHATSRVRQPTTHLKSPPQQCFPELQKSNLQSSSPMHTFHIRRNTGTCSLGAPKRFPEVQKSNFQCAHIIWHLSTSATVSHPLGFQATSRGLWARGVSRKSKNRLYVGTLNTRFRSPSPSPRYALRPSGMPREYTGSEATRISRLHSQNIRHSPHSLESPISQALSVAPRSQQDFQN